MSIEEKNVKMLDGVANSLRTYAQYILVVVFGLLPLFFIPTIVAPFDYTKFFVVLIAVFVALVLYSLSVLRSGVIVLGVSSTLVALWVVAGISFLSSLLSGDFKDSLIGDLFSIHSTILVALIALIPTIWVALRAGKMPVMRMYMLLSVSTLILVGYQVLRLFFGVDFLSFDVFTSNVSTPVGGWNDLALFLGLVVILALVALEQVSLTHMGRTLFSIVTFVSLIMLGVINFFTVWVVLGVTSLVIIVYTLGKDRFGNSQLPFVNVEKRGTGALGVSIMVFAVSVLFIIGGATLGGWLSKYTHVTYVEVRPSLEATANIARNVYHENAFLGIGTNKFTDAWRLYKEDAINLTPFWNTDFNAGNGYITTFFVTTGFLGGLAWIVFLFVYIGTGVRSLLSATTGDKAWYFIGVSSFVSAVYIWGMSLVYVPGVVILLLGALCTGVSLGAINVLTNKEERVFTVGTNRRTGFIMTLTVITVIISSVSLLYVVGRHYTSVYTFNESLLAVQQGTPVDELQRQVGEAYQLSTSDVFLRKIAEYQLSRMSEMMKTLTPASTEEELKAFISVRNTGLEAAQLALKIDGEEPANWSVLGNIYGLLATVGFEGAQKEAIAALEKSREFNPKNPLPYLESAIVEAHAGNYEVARSYIEKAIQLKSNYTEAFFLLSQLEITTGNVEGAIRSTQAVINLEPQNPTRYYQLGVLESSRANVSGALPAFEKAVALDPNYANARYLLALAYDEVGRSEEAKKQLEVVQELNPGNTDVANLIKVITDEGSLTRLRSDTNKTVNEVEPIINENGTVSTTKSSDTSLVAPVNTIPKIESTESTEAQ